jgi:hypothetical protein
VSWASLVMTPRYASSSTFNRVFGACCGRTQYPRNTRRGRESPQPRGVSVGRSAARADRYRGWGGGVAVGSWCARHWYGSLGGLTQHGPQRCARWNMPPLWHLQRGSITSSRGRTSPGSYQRSASAVRSSLPGRLPRRPAPSAAECVARSVPVKARSLRSLFPPACPSGSFST